MIAVANLDHPTVTDGDGTFFRGACTYKVVPREGTRGGGGAENIEKISL
jgi:hypothetical protein